MPPYRNDIALPPLTRLLKTELVDLASDFHLADDGTVANLRLRIRNHLVANPALLMKQKYTDLLPNYKPPDSPPPSYKTLPSQTNLDVPKSVGFRDPLHDQAPRPPHSRPHQPVKGRPPVVPGMKAEYQPFMIPEIVRKRVIKGWLEHIPLTYLTDQFCVPGGDQGIKGYQQFKLNRCSEIIIRVEVPLDDTEEHNLSFEDWHGAWVRFLDLLRSYHPTLHGPWKIHFDRICFAPDRSSSWSTWLAYDISLRKQSVHDGIDPKIFHRSHWYLIATDFAKNSISRPLSNQATQSSPRSSGPSRKSPRSSDLATSSTSHAPYGNRPHQRGTSHRCLRCGGPHIARGCFARTQINGLPVVIFPREDGKLIRDAEGNRYCLSFNGVTGCTSRNCSNGHHRCTLCKGLEHNAQICPSI
ncbi:hypothetical protein AGABI2DRAFT_121418 [Agaricus bisporus var. bisporus H97]|uniref:hypothetical protein n=1 Tax=Agaricus bisporus var. bisporus (strain H97 / ATCC MYA-4626 / FGSC 10389) TaxID=936046 RepID=UPI00029F743F|nr:hypothetical protein AGABI2DRAFT_121418 [Agaricus bisporus var. bisporus H97]EKV44238.1 hypothetical protein AGABI2DRAFT_121418 [Agaricus bisporus var. bisporus H97]